MLKRILLPVFGIAAMAAVASAEAKIALNGIMLNGIMLNGIMLNGPGSSGDAALQAVRLTLPDGAELTFR